MDKPLGQTGRFSPGQRRLSAADLNAVFDFVRDLRRNITVSPPLEIRTGSAGVHLSASLRGLPAGEKGEILYHDGTEWVSLAAPAADGVLFFDSSTGLPRWIETTEDCPAATTTAPPVTTTTQGATTTAPPVTTTTVAGTTTTAGATTTQGATTTAPPTTTSAGGTTTTTPAATTTTQDWNPGEDKCCRDEQTEAFVCSPACTQTLIRACSAGGHDSCPAKTGNCHYTKAGSKGACDPDCKYLHSHNDCNPYGAV